MIYAILLVFALIAFVFAAAGVATIGGHVQSVPTGLALLVAALIAQKIPLP